MDNDRNKFVVLVSDKPHNLSICHFNMAGITFSGNIKSRKDTADVDILIVHGLVVTMDPSFRVLEDGALAIRDGRIADLGETADILSRYHGRKVIDAHRKLILPGLINAHTHAPMNIYRGYADDLSLNEWLYGRIFPLEMAFVNRDNVRMGTQLAIAEMLRSGTTTFNDMYYYSDVMAEVVDQCGIRAVLSEGLFDEPVHNAKTAADVLRFTEEMIHSWNGHPRLRIGVAVHAPYSAKPALYRAANELAEKHQVLLSTHLSETRWEFDQIKKQYGYTPVKHLENLGVLGPHLVIAHGIYLTREDMELLARYDVGVAHNPQCNMKLANGTAPIPELQHLGVRGGIGTDGVASNNDLDLFDEIRSSALTQKLVTGDPTVMDARTVLECVTIGGARLLGMEKMIGSLEAGKQADIILLDLKHPHAWPHYNIYSLIVYSLRGSDVETVMVDGRLLMENREITCLDQEKLYDEVQSVQQKISSWHLQKQTGGG